MFCVMGYQYGAVLRKWEGGYPTRGGDRDTDHARRGELQDRAGLKLSPPARPHVKSLSGIPS